MIKKNYEWGFYGTILPENIQEQYNDWQCDKESPNDTYQTFNFSEEDEDDDGAKYPELAQYIKEEFKKVLPNDELPSEILIFVSW